jgi:hypothetical protein
MPPIILDKNIVVTFVIHYLSAISVETQIFSQKYMKYNEKTPI